MRPLNRPFGEASRGDGGGAGDVPGAPPVPRGRKTPGTGGQGSPTIGEMPKIDHDLIIVGAGPAGSATALHLARRAPALAQRSLILERYRHPRTKL